MFQLQSSIVMGGMCWVRKVAVGIREAPDEKPVDSRGEVISSQ